MFFCSGIVPSVLFNLHPATSIVIENMLAAFDTCPNSFSINWQGFCDIFLKIFSLNYSVSTK